MPNKRGFTLIELLLVIAIIALLTTIAISVFGKAQSKARDAKRKSDVDSIANALETNYNFNTKVYPTLTGNFFTGGTIPTAPDNAPYPIFWQISSGQNYAFIICTQYETNELKSSDPNIIYDYCRKSLHGDCLNQSGLGSKCGDAIYNPACDNNANCVIENSDFSP